MSLLRRWIGCAAALALAVLAAASCSESSETAETVEPVWLSPADLPDPLVRPPLAQIGTRISVESCSIGASGTYRGDFRANNPYDDTVDPIYELKIDAISLGHITAPAPPGDSTFVVDTADLSEEAREVVVEAVGRPDDEDRFCNIFVRGSRHEESDFAVNFAMFGRVADTPDRQPDEQPSSESPVSP